MLTLTGRHRKISISITNDNIIIIFKIFFFNKASAAFSLEASVVRGDTGSQNHCQWCFPGNYCKTGPCKPPQGSINQTRGLLPGFENVEGGTLLHAIWKIYILKEKLKLKHENKGSK